MTPHPATQTLPGSIAIIALRLAAEQAFSLTSKRGHVFDFAVEVEDGPRGLVCSLPVNAVLTKKAAIEKLNAFWRDLIVALRAEFGDDLRVDGAPLMKKKVNGAVIWTHGLWHMGHYSPSYVMRGIEMGRKVEIEAVAS